MQHTFTKYKNSSDGGTDVRRGNNWAGGVSARSAAAKCCLPDIRCAAPAFCSDSGTNGGRTHAPATSAALVRFFRRLQGVFVCCAAILFFGCGTILPPQGDESSANETQNPSQKTYTVSGNIAMSGAVPSAVSAQNAVSGATGGGTENTVYGAVQNDADKTAAAQETPGTSLDEPAGTNARNARPSVDGTTVSYTVTVTDANDATKTQTLPLAAGETDFSFNLPEGTYTFSAEGFVEDADGTRKKILSGSYKNAAGTPPDTVSVPTATPAGTIAVAVASAATGSGTGTVNLLMECSDCKQFTAEWNDKSGTPKTMNISVPAESTGWYRYIYFTMDENGNGSNASKPEVPVGQYEVTFTFYGYQGASLPYYKMYSCTEIINVCENMTTDYWEQDAQSLHCTGDGKFELTSAAIAEFRFRDRHDFYVDQTNGTIDGDGSRYSPMNDVWSAVYYIQHRNDGKPYTVHLLSDWTNGSEYSSQNHNHYSVMDIDPSSAFNLTIDGGGHTINAARTDTYTGRVMYISENTTLTLDNVVITGGKCATNYSGADGACGGGIYNKGTLTLKNGASVQGNAAYLKGGGIYNDGGTVTIAGGAVSKNTGSNGGGIANASGTVVLKDGTISENTDSSDYGGGIYNIGGTVTVEGGTIHKNTAAYKGGGIYNNVNGSLTVKGGVISENEAGNDGGGIYNSGTFAFSDGILSGDKALGLNGGGIYHYTGTAVITGGVISSCTAAYNGGGIYNQATITISNCRIIGCESKINSTNNIWGGGGIFTYNNTKIEISGGEITDCIAAARGGGICIAANADAKIAGCTITGCKTTATTSGTGGGGIYSVGTLTVTGGILSGCIAGANGGGIYVYGGTLECSGGVVFYGCEAGTEFDGGGICNTGGVTAAVSGCTFELCTAARGGGIRNSGQLRISDTTFKTCSATETGGGIWNSGTVTPGTNITYTGCTPNDTYGF